MKPVPARTLLLAAALGLSIATGLALATAPTDAAPADMPPTAVRPEQGPEPVAVRAAIEERLRQPLGRRGSTTAPVRPRQAAPAR